MLNPESSSGQALFQHPISQYNDFMDGSYYVYILTNRPRGTLYIGVTNNLERRILEHKQHQVKGFTHQYNLSRLVYFEVTPNIQSAIAREKQLKNWHRPWKINLIEKSNPGWSDLSQDWFE